MDTILARFAAILKFFQESRLAALVDTSAWLLIAPALAALYLIEPALAKTFAQWSIFGLVLAGASIVISRIVFPQVKLTELVESAHIEKNTAAAIIVAAIIGFVALVMLSLVIWAKA